MQRVESIDEDEDSDQEDVVLPSFKVAEQEVNCSYFVIIQRIGFDATVALI